MARLLGMAPWALGWGLILLGVFILVGGTATWVAAYVQPMQLDAPSWLTLVSLFTLALVCYVLGFIAHAVAATRQHQRRQVALKALQEELDTSA
jgi:formate hydrogenlyase subunit 3/multisubunit Na+/H+ antiporter MnhD subunit